MEESKYTLTNFKSTDIFTMATLLSKIGLGKIMDYFGKDNVLQLLNGAKENDENAQSVVGMGIMVQAVEIILGNLDKCKAEIYALLFSASGINTKDLEKMDAVDFAELIIEVVEMEQFKDFFKVALRLYNKVMK